VLRYVKQEERARSSIRLRIALCSFVSIAGRSVFPPAAGCPVTQKCCYETSIPEVIGSLSPTRMEVCVFNLGTTSMVHCRVQRAASQYDQFSTVVHPRATSDFCSISSATHGRRRKFSDTLNAVPNTDFKVSGVNLDQVQPCTSRSVGSLVRTRSCRTRREH
jgi:hypothetical protein